MNKPVYLDYAAATPVDPRVLKAMYPFFTDQFYNPSALYLASRKVKVVLNESRKKVAEVLIVRPAEIIFTAGGTEANNLAVRGIMELYPGKKLLVSAVEHESVNAAAALYKYNEIKVDKHGRVVIDDLVSKIDDDVVLISVIFASNEIGTIQDLKGITEIISKVKVERKRRGVDTPLYTHTDATQAAGYVHLSPKQLGVDLMTINGGKIYGPKQSGILYLRTGVSIKPIIYGGGQEKNLRSGTENVVSCVGFSEALRIAQETAESESKRLTMIRDELRLVLKRLPIEIVFHGHPKNRMPNHLSFAVVGYENERLMMELDERGFLVATGSACSASKADVSHVLKAVGVSESLARSTLRVTLGRETTRANISGFSKALSKILSGNNFN